jgi:hypothetical protein
MKSKRIEAKNILNNCNIEEQTEIPYVSRFLMSLLKEQDALPSSEEQPAAASDVANTQKSPDEFTPEMNQKDFKGSMEPGTDPQQFDTEGVSAQSTAEIIASIREWSTKLDEFAEFLNDPAQTTSEGKPSLHKILSDGDRSGSLLRGITRKASDSITRIAGEVEKLKEILNTYIITAPKKMRDTEGQPGWTQF